MGLSKKNAVMKTGDTMTGALSVPSLNINNNEQYKAISLGDNGNSHYEITYNKNDGSFYIYDRINNKVALSMKPAINEIYQYGTRIPKITTSTTAPANPQAGDIWIQV
jgi:hypothetical protein